MAIKIENLNFKFNDNTILYDNCNFTIKDGKMTVILGLNGAGKTTLFKIMSGKIKPYCKIENTFKNIFYLPQTPFCPTGVTTFDYLSTVFFKNSFKWYISKEEKEKTNDALNKIGLYHKRDVEVDRLSGGEFQKINLALSIISDADLLLLDEPVSSLDIINQKQVLDTIKSLKTTSTVIMHDLNLAANWGDEFIAINKNRKIVQLKKENFFTEENLKDIFGADFKVIKNDEKYYVQIIN